MKTCDRTGVGAFGSGGVGEEAPIPPHSRLPTPFLTSQSRQVCCWSVFLLALLFGLTGCAYYGFSSATIPQEQQTITIVPVENATTSPIRDLEGTLTDLLNERFVERTRLQRQTNANDADVVLSGRLTGYSEAPTAVSGEERATQNEVTIRAQIQYRATENDSLLLDDTYTQSETYVLSSGDGAQSAAAAAQVALENIADAVFADATSNW